MEVTAGEILRYLLDTNIVSELTKAVPNDEVVHWLGRPEVAQNCYLSVITITEIREGISLLPEGKKRKVLESWLQDHLIPTYFSQILPITLGIADRTGALMGEQRRRGFSPDLNDVYLAATAIELDMHIATLNRKHFERLGVSIAAF